ncbi:MAG: MarR family transcriptional regulator [Devosia sp.]|uniref:MarR family winged helix-turn-helix transcriptional regulator n=1 Tax=Devosia sp. TaxID=1871048 RepID=UPI00261E7EAB|nr:MarR family transcriptional regulator [Devosia sp.]MDB5529404.1 MarR family transcriptional regulator [Devosia sp.]
MPQDRIESAGAEAIRLKTLSKPGYVEHEELFYLIVELSRHISTQFDKLMLRHRLTHSQWWALMHIYKQEGLTQSALATLMQMGRASAGALLEKLAAAGWIERRPDPSDSRVRRVFLTLAAIPVFEQMQAEGETQFKVFLKGVTLAEERQLIDGLRRIRTNSEQHDASSALES